LSTVVEKFDTVETCTPYVAAPVTAFQLKLGVTETPVATSAGEASVGVPTIVVKLEVVE
jgi:hypothetical protein